MSFPFSLTLLTLCDRRHWGIAGVFTNSINMLKWSGELTAPVCGITSWKSLCKTWRSPRRRFNLWQGMERSAVSMTHTRGSDKIRGLLHCSLSRKHSGLTLRALWLFQKTSFCLLVYVCWSHGSATWVLGGRYVILITPGLFLRCKFLLS